MMTGLECLQLLVAIDPDDDNDEHPGRAMLDEADDHIESSGIDFDSPAPAGEELDEE